MCRFFLYGLVSIILSQGTTSKANAQPSERVESSSKSQEDKSGFFGFGYGYWAFASFEKYDDDDFGDVGVHVPFLVGGFHINRYMDVILGVHLPAAQGTFLPIATVVHAGMKFKLTQAKVVPFLQTALAIPVVYPYPLGMQTAGLEIHLDETNSLIAQWNLLTTFTDIRGLGYGGSINYQVSF